MKSVAVSVAVPQSPQEVFAFLDVLANHQAFTDHFLLDWELSGPRAASAPGPECASRSPEPTTGWRWRWSPRSRPA